jgi:hypothetical protein
MPERESFQSWLHHPQTIQLLEILQKWREEEKEKWASGALTTPDHFATAVKEAEAIGRCQTCNDILTMEYEGFIRELGYESVEPSSQQ